MNKCYNEQLNEYNLIKNVHLKSLWSRMICNKSDKIDAAF